MADEDYPPYKCPYDHEFHSADDFVFYYPATGFIETIEEALLTAHAFRDANDETYGIWQSVLVPRSFVAAQGHAGFCLRHYDYCWLRHVVVPMEVGFLEEEDDDDDDNNDAEMLARDIIRDLDDPTFPAGFEADWMEEAESVFEEEEEDSDEEGLYRPPTPPGPNTTRVRVEKEEEEEEEEAAAVEERYDWTAGRTHFPFELRQSEVRQPEPDYSVWPRVRYYRY